MSAPAPRPDHDQDHDHGPVARPSGRGGQRVAVAVVCAVVAGAAVWAFAARSSGPEAAPGAAAPECAALLRALPDDLDGLPRDRAEAARGVAVWGREQVVLRCGSTVLGPTTEPCLPVGPDGTSSVDWVRDAQNARAVRFLTYGRDPAVEVTVRFGDGLDAAGATAHLVDLAAPVTAAVPQTRTCL